MRSAGRVIQKSEIRSLLATPAWTVHDLVEHAAPLKNPPKEEDLLRLSKLAGLDPPTPKMLRSFVNQLKFVELLRDIDTTNVEPVTRLIDTVEVPDLTNALDDTTTAPEVGHWNPVDCASEKESHYYVVKDTLHGEH